MRYVGWALGILTTVVVVYLGALVLVGGDTVTDNYATLDDARADKLFERGWLPDILPSSARDIRITSNLDLNDSWGEFSFESRDYALFVAKTQPYTAQSEKLDKEAQARQRGGYDVRLFTEGSTWIFYCKAEVAHCEYVL